MRPIAPSIPLKLIGWQLMKLLCRTLFLPGRFLLSSGIFLFIAMLATCASRAAVTLSATSSDGLLSHGLVLVKNVKHLVKGYDWKQGIGLIDGINIYV
ncbi:hypothetical protein Tco_1135211 [Tanacetum coccineum]